MNKTTITIILLALLIVITGCSKPVGTSPAEKRDFALQMRKDTLTELYEAKPEARAKIADAPGYGVFSNININVLLLSTGHGYGVVHDTKTGDDTYMKMAMVGAGLGLGAKDFRAVIIFKTPEALEKFATKGWEFGGHADAAAKSGEKGGEAGGQAEVTRSMEIYTFTESGIALQATLAGTKYWKDEALN
ncbi:MAG: lipid-binding SYLF domain-containing protein [Planctomycetota bacterium]|jgi:lipid-binding SYLF domain-containing protein